MKDFNLSEWALKHQAMVLFLILALIAAGASSYFKLGRAEDPEFTFKVMIVRSFWPGATTREVEQQLTDRIEKKLQEVPNLDVLRSYSKPGESLVFLTLKDYTPPKEVPNAWYQVRKKLGDVRQTLPEGVRGPFFNDEFGDTFGLVYALSGEGFTLPDLRRQADDIARQLKGIPDVGKVELFGVQDEKIFVEIASAKLATLGLDPLQIVRALQEQNAMTPAGYVDTSDERIYLRVSGDFNTVAQIREIGIRAGGRTLRLGDLATVTRGLADPPTPRFRWKGKDGIGIAVAMAKGGNVQALGANLDRALLGFERALPVGMTMEKVADQPAVVKRSIDEFMSTLLEAIVIVLAVSFLSLGWRTGMVVALSIPLVLAITFFAMRLFGIDLQRISLGALIIALGLLVDDAIIAVEMMVVKIEQGYDKFQAATFAYTSTAFPMLTGTLITAAGFTPVGFAKSAAGEFTFSIFAVVSIALIASWIVAVIFTPYIGFKTLNVDKLRAIAEAHPGGIYETAFYRRFRRLLEWCLVHRRLVIGITVATFVLSIVGFVLGVDKQFFPSSNRPELLVDLRLSQGASIAATEREARRVEQMLQQDPVIKPHIEHFVAYVGAGSPRFYLPLDQQMPNDNFAQLVVMTRDAKVREIVRQRLLERLEVEFSAVQTRVQRLENGPPVGFPVVFRVSGPDPEVLRQTAIEVARVMRANRALREVNFDWGELTKQLRLEIDQDKARALGVSSQSISA
ncbi:MAG TPA: efflux RND transporter permease subunit, partial [Rhodocyclaceae bacterium]|nr:efflux RND transporter permease subunit [Rhodocyclaceae bacterium]